METYFHQIPATRKPLKCQIRQKCKLSPVHRKEVMFTINYCMKCTCYFPKSSMYKKLKIKSRERNEPTKPQVTILNKVYCDGTCVYVH